MHRTLGSNEEMFNRIHDQYVYQLQQDLDLLHVLLGEKRVGYHMMTEVTVQKEYAFSRCKVREQQ